MQLLFACTIASIKGLIETKNMASAWILLTPQKREELNVLNYCKSQASALGKRSYSTTIALPIPIVLLIPLRCSHNHLCYCAVNWIKVKINLEKENYVFQTSEATQK